LIETDTGLILIDGALPQSSPLIDSNIRKLGFDPLNIKAILVSHAHFDHAGGVNALQRLTGAAVYTSVSGEKSLSNGELQDDDPQFLNGLENSAFPAIRNVVAVGDGDIVTIGGVDVKAIYTPGHTPGGMTWTWESCALGTCYDIVYADSLTAVSAEGYRFSDGPAANQLIESAGAISEVYCDILLSPHPFFFGMQAKLEKRDGGNPFVNNVACMIYAESALDWLEQRLRSEGS
jgi:metallo-beta-lactamase class B